MIDLDDLIRQSLREHTHATAPDDTLAELVVAKGRHVRRTRAAGLAATALVAVAGLAWGWAALPLLAQQGIAAAPTMSRPTPSEPTPAPKATVRNVAKLGDPSEGANGTTFLRNDFASPTGNFHCFISTAGAGCSGEKWDKGVKPSRKTCGATEGAVLGPELWGGATAAWECGSDPHSLPFLADGADAGGKGVAWWDPTFGDSIPFPPDSSVRLAVLPYGKTLVAGDFSCSMARDGVTCSNAVSGHGFRVSRAKVDLGH
ncbi:MAG TPA: hypothetical protein VGK18_11475 [Propionicimonas sp.]|uniref:hypothetical protein n=1 Tax=Propionicimonas sp. TaxID=1955623 RepID=UPI002F3E2BBA